MVWDNREDRWGDFGPQMIGRASVRIELTLMFKTEKSSEAPFHPMTRTAMRRQAEELRRLANEIDRACSYGLEGGNRPHYPLASALFQIKGSAISANKQIASIVKAERAAATPESGQWENDNPSQELTATGTGTVDTVGTGGPQDAVLKVVR